jgi:hypothetical protein
VKRDAAFRKGLLSKAIESLLSGEVTLGKPYERTDGYPPKEQNDLLLRS